MNGKKTSESDITRLYCLHDATLQSNNHNANIQTKAWRVALRKHPEVALRGNEFRVDELVYAGGRGVEGALTFRHEKSN